MSVPDTTCSGAPSGFDQVYNGQAYKRFLDTEMEYEDAQKTCRDLGGALPTIDTQEEFLATKKIAGRVIH